MGDGEGMAVEGGDMDGHSPGEGMNEEEYKQHQEYMQQ